jgi:hypothetical protein
MSDVKTLPIPPALYDFVLYWECANKNWLNLSKKSSIKGDGSLIEYIDWNSTYSFDPNDSGGNTLFGVTESAWKSYVKKYPNKGYSSDLNKMGQRGWFDQIEWFWNIKSSSSSCANYACAFMMFQMVWVGFGANAQKLILDTLKKNADIKDYTFITSGSNYAKIADATHAYKDPMMAFDFMRKANASYYYNISGPNSKNKGYRNGWLSRSILSFLPYGLYIPTSFTYKQVGLRYESTLNDWYSTALRLVQENKKGFVKIMDWGTPPDTLDKMTSDTFNYTPPNNELSSNSSNSFNSNNNLYSGHNCVNQLGNYSKGNQNKDVKIPFKSNINREEILKTLINGSYMQNDVKKCSEFTTSDKKKNN